MGEGEKGGIITTFSFPCPRDHRGMPSSLLVPSIFPLHCRYALKETLLKSSHLSLNSHHFLLPFAHFAAAQHSLSPNLSQIPTCVSPCLRAGTWTCLQKNLHPILTRQSLPSGFLHIYIIKHSSLRPNPSMMMGSLKDN